MDEEISEVEVWRQRAEALRSALRLDTLHWEGAVRRAREMFSFLGQGRKDLPLDDGESDSDFVVRLPPCPQCGGSTEFKVCSNLVDCVDRTGCGWRGLLEVVGYQAGPPPPFVHELKCWPVPFQAAKAGDKTMELRRDDREPRFAPGHRLRLREYDPGAMDVVGDKGAYTGDELLVEVTAVYREESAIPEGYTLMSVQPVDDDLST